jgi:diguanylate cyclase (GGDEF)-like protein/PAS domain S-box-containing protein
MHVEELPQQLASSAPGTWDWQALLDDLPVGAFVAHDGRFLFVNKALARKFGYTQQEMLDGVSSLELAVPEDRETVKVHVRRRRHMVPELPYEVECLRKDGSRFDARICGLRIDVAGQELDLVTLADITSTRDTMRATQAMSERLMDRVKKLSLNTAMLDILPKPVIAVDLAGQLRYANDAACKLLGYDRDHLLAQTIFAIAPHRRPDSWKDNLASLQQSGTRTFTSDWLSANGRSIAMKLTASYLSHEGQGFAVICQDDDASPGAAPMPVPHTAHFCDITGLPNQQMLREKLRSEALLAIMDRRDMAVLVFTVNEIQQINEEMGYACGDQLLMMLTKHLSNIPKGSDVLAHLGGGEFVLMFSHANEVNDDVTLQLSRTIQDAITAPLQLNKRFFQLTCNIGVVIFPRDTNESEHVLRQAQAAMRMAVSLGPNRIYGYTPQANAHISARMVREAALRGALMRNELRLEYQPQIDLKTGHITGVEALIRWQHPELGDVPPTEFVPIAEDTGQIIAIGTWVLRQACEAAARWQQANLPAVRVAVNLSPRQLQQPDIASVIESVLMQTGLPPHCLTIEVTERMLHDKQDVLAETLKHIKSIGVSIALDDFGTGYSSLRSLRTLPIDMIKIDRSLVPDVTTETKDVSITRAIINMAHGLQKKVLAVGVENAGELALLCANQCDQMQGFYFSEPVSEDALVLMLGEHKCLPDHALGRQKRKRTLLIVDDDQNIVSALKRLLRKDGYHIVTADSGQQGLQKLAENEVDVIISDQRMPGMTGVEFLRRTKELYPETIRMVLSGFTELQSATDAINEGAIYKFLTKPWEDEQLRTHIQEAFLQKEMSDDNHRLDREVQEANRELADVNGRLQHLLTSQRERMHREETNLIVAREMLENIPTPVLGLDDTGLIAFMNSDAERMFKGSAAMLGQHIEDIDERALAEIWRLNDGLYHDITLAGRGFRAVCRPMTGDTRSRGSLMVLAPSLSTPIAPLEPTSIQAGETRP